MSSYWVYFLDLYAAAGYAERPSVPAVVDSHSQGWSRSKIDSSGVHPGGAQSWGVMPVYLVVLPDDSDIAPEDHPAIQGIETFQDRMTIIEDRLWVIRTDLETCGQVSKALKFGETPDEHSGIVFTVTSSDGYHYVQFWSKLHLLRAKRS